MNAVDLEAVRFRVRRRALLLSIRIPSHAMLEVGCAAHPPNGYGATTTLMDIIRAEWIAMIDKLLESV